MTSIVICTLLVKSDKFTPTGQYNLSFNIDNCSLLITDNPDTSSKNPVYISYKAPSGLFTDATTVVNLDDPDNPQDIEVFNGLDSRYCSIQLYVAKNTQLDSLKINCPNCNLTQDTSSQLKIKNDLIITGQSVNANFRDIQVGSIQYEATTGYLQLNHIDSKSNNNTITMSDEGDIIIQSTTNFRIDATSDTQAFCFSAPFLRNINATNCLFSGQSKYFLYFSLLIAQ